VLNRKTSDLFQAPRPEPQSGLLLQGEIAGTRVEAIFARKAEKARKKTHPAAISGRWVGPVGRNGLLFVAGALYSKPTLFVRRIACVTILWLISPTASLLRANNLSGQSAFIASYPGTCGLGGELYEGVIDLAWFDGMRWTVVDYKTESADGGDRTARSGSR
jgi:hypothetical protein